MKSLGAILLATQVALTFTASAKPAEMATKFRGSLDVHALSPRAGGLKAQQDLLSLLSPGAEWIREYRTREYGFRMHTRPQSTGLGSLCFRDELFLDYAVTVPTGADREQPAQPIGVTAKRTYHVIDGPLAEWEHGSAQDRRHWMATCAKLESDKSARWFADISAGRAAMAANLVRAAVAELQAGRLEPEACNISVVSACKDTILRSAQATKIINVARNCAAGSDLECYDIVVGEGEDQTHLRIVATFDENSLVPKTIISIMADEGYFELGGWDGIYVDPKPHR